MNSTNHFYEKDNCSYYYTCREGKVTITGFSGYESRVEVPEQIEGAPVCIIAKKTFLGNKHLEEITFPDSLEEIGDWAFAYCSKLKHVTLPRKSLRLGKDVFTNCPGLSEIRFADGEKPNVAKHLAAAATIMEAPYLLDFGACHTPEWMEQWDARLQTIVNTPDEEGYYLQVLCGEEDYGSTDKGAYMSGRRSRKIRLLFLRLLDDLEKPAGFKTWMERYLLDHTKGCESEETWTIIHKEHGRDKAYYQLFAGIGCLTSENLPGILDDIKDEYPEMKAYFINYAGNGSGGGDFFAGLDF